MVNSRSIFSSRFCDFLRHQSKKLCLLFAIVISIGLSSCGKDDKYYEQAYNQSYDELLTLRMNINNLAKDINVKPEDLIRMRYGLINANPELTEVLSNLCEAFREHNNDKVTDILNEDYNFEISTKIQSVSKDKLLSTYRTNVFARNEQFDNDIPMMVSKDLNYGIEKYMDKKFAWYRFPINAWDYIWEGEANLKAQYSTGLKDVLSTNKINSQLVSRFNDYNALIIAEQKVLFDKQLSLPDLKKIELEDADKIADTAVMDKFIERASIDLTDTILTLIEEVGVAIIIWFVFRLLTNKIVNWYARTVLDYDLNYGFWGNALVLGWNLISSWSENEELRKLSRIKFWVQTIVAIGFIIATYFYVIKPQIVVEQDLLANVETNVSSYVEKMDVPILDYFNNVIDSL